MSNSQGDVNDAIAYVRNNAESLSVEKDRSCLWAFSAGGLFLSQALRDAPSYVRCMVAYYAVLDLQPLRADIPAAVTDETLKEFSPAHHLGGKGKGAAPLFVMRAGRDDAKLNAGVDRFVQEAMAKNLTIDFSNYAEGRHGFDVLDNNERSREIIKRTLEFISAHTKQ